MTKLYIQVRASKYKNLTGDLADNLSGLNPIFYGLGPGGEHRCLEEETLYSYEPKHDYRSGHIVTKDGTRMATTQAKALEAGWPDVAEMLAEWSIK